MASTPVVRIFRHPSEAEARSAFSLDCAITEENFCHIVGPIRFTEDTKVRCQIRQPQNAYRCKQEHWNGWVVANNDGEEGYIGSVCGDRDLKASERYRLEKKRVNAEIRLIEFLEIIGEILADRPDYERRVNELSSRIREIDRKAGNIRDSLPQRIKERLQQMHRTGNRRVGVSYLDIKRDKEGNEERTWTPHFVGNIGGVSIIDFKTTATPLHKIEKIERCLSEVRLDRSAGIENLKRWSETFGTLNAVAEEVTNAENQFSAFAELSNLALLLLLNDKSEIRAEVAAVVMTEQGHESPSKRESKAFAENYYATLKAARKNDGMRLL